ncbi:hypothetical protein H6P81_006728 [Aristolochia fimbriata]|uniref:Uncharacterized protein n=1 Tax=Aristolochia fimbriata TaxID=158543 RepID=A0AAV7EZ10_ARIFI|nr:hypothetical protein H6P81_006728 [Aristolochia fimbriata]
MFPTLAVRLWQFDLPVCLVLKTPVQYPIDSGSSIWHHLRPPTRADDYQRALYDTNNPQIHTDVNEGLRSQKLKYSLFSRQWMVLVHEEGREEEVHPPPDKCILTQIDHLLDLNSFKSVVQISSKTSYLSQRYALALSRLCL